MFKNFILNPIIQRILNSTIFDDVSSKLETLRMRSVSLRLYKSEIQLFTKCFAFRVLTISRQFFFKAFRFLKSQNLKILKVKSPFKVYSTIVESSAFHNRPDSGAVRTIASSNRPFNYTGSGAVRSTQNREILMSFFNLNSSIQIKKTRSSIFSILQSKREKIDKETLCVSLLVSYKMLRISSFSSKNGRFQNENRLRIASQLYGQCAIIKKSRLKLPNVSSTDSVQFGLNDFIDIQRKSFQELLENGIIHEFLNRNPIIENHLEVFFYPDYYQLSSPEYTIREAILKGKSYSSKLYMPVQFTNKKTKKIILKWYLIGELPIMTKRGNFILNGAPRVIVNQLIRSPGLYFQEKKIPLYANEKDEKPFAVMKRYYADFICLRGIWLRLEIDKEKNIWAQFKKGPKMPALWFLYAMGLSETMIFKNITNSTRLLSNFKPSEGMIERPRSQKQSSSTKNFSSIELSFQSEKKKFNKKNLYKLINSPRQAWREIADLLKLSNNSISNIRDTKETRSVSNFDDFASKSFDAKSSKKPHLNLSPHLNNLKTDLRNQHKIKTFEKEELGRKWLYNRFMNPRNYDLGKLGRFSLNQKLGLHISPIETTLTPQDILYATDFLFKVEKGLRNIDDIDHLMNRKIRTSGELIQMQIGIGVVRLEKTIREKLENFSKNDLINAKIMNGTLREFFGTNPLSQFMDQINPLAEITHKRRLSSMGPGGVGRENAPMAIRSIHPTHYGRICPIETPEGKNTGLVNSLTTCAQVTYYGSIQTPFYKVYKGQVQKDLGIFYLNTEQEEKIRTAPPDLTISGVGFLPNAILPARYAAEFLKMKREQIQYIGFNSIQMISIATSLIPFLEHDDANRALMGSNMQRQAVPIIRPERPIVGTGLEARAACDSGHIIQSKSNGFISYVSADKIVVYKPDQSILK